MALVIYWTMNTNIGFSGQHKHPYILWEQHGLRVLTACSGILNHWHHHSLSRTTYKQNVSEPELSRGTGQHDQGRAAACYSLPCQPYLETACSSMHYSHTPPFTTVMLPCLSLPAIYSAILPTSPLFIKVALQTTVCHAVPCFCLNVFMCKYPFLSLVSEAP